ncbi:hypothetical protein SISNIDRAFT_455542 [Sistotremastrum niveocremeum HHB9708]|uniref:Uncharacterized protein n=1 Tax=Sistotremastrum niveocremeum HHB9708 TaxID=1314777 RepID=A0A164THW3_9AGAM|nr:hypothetical protein SISNIDRAFT_455542 [Sistotremastrum niveocremeum HHB9708]
MNTHKHGGMAQGSHRYANDSDIIRVPFSQNSSPSAIEAKGPPSSNRASSLQKAGRNPHNRAHVRSPGANDEEPNSQQVWPYYAKPFQPQTSENDDRAAHQEHKQVEHKHKQRVRTESQESVSSSDSSGSTSSASSSSQSAASTNSDIASVEDTGQEPQTSSLDPEDSGELLVFGIFQGGALCVAGFIAPEKTPNQGLHGVAQVLTIIGLAVALYGQFLRTIGPVNEETWELFTTASITPTQRCLYKIGITLPFALRWLGTFLSGGGAFVLANLHSNIGIGIVFGGCLICAVLLFLHAVLSKWRNIDRQLDEWLECYMKSVDEYPEKFEFDGGHEIKQLHVHFEPRNT